MTINATPFVSGSILTAAQMTNLPMGLAGNTGATATTGFSANTALSVLSVAVTIYAGRTYQIFGKLAVQYSSSATVGAALYVNANSIDRTLYYQTEVVPANLAIGISGFTTYTAAELGVTSGSSSKTFLLNWKSGAGGSLTANPDGFVAAGSFSQQILIMDIGPT